MIFFLNESVFNSTEILNAKECYIIHFLTSRTMTHLCRSTPAAEPFRATRYFSIIATHTLELPVMRRMLLVMAGVER